MKKKSGFVIVGLLTTIAAVSALSGSGKKAEGAQASKPVGQLISIEPLPAMEMGEICYMPPASASLASASASLRAYPQAPAATSQGRVPIVPSAALQSQIANRRPARILDDAYPSYSAVALDVAHNEVVLAAENNLSIFVHDRTQNTPPRARSEPKRMINGLNTYVEYV